MSHKLVSLAQAADLVQPNSLLAIGGMTLYRRPMAFIRALLQRRRHTGAPHNLTLLAFTASIESDLLVGSGMLAAVRTCYFGLEIFGLAPMFTEYAGNGSLRVIEETEVSLACGLQAAASKVGFIPARAWLGTDLPALRPDVKTIQDPYSSETLMAFPAITPDTLVVHALRADPEGNAEIGRHRSADIEMVLAARQTIITAEEIVPRLERADITAPFVHAVAAAPGGAAPTSCHPHYRLDARAIQAYSETVTNQASFDRHLETLLG
jgi:glutaconate CoA-transferase subunit A